MRSVVQALLFSNGAEKNASPQLSNSPVDNLIPGVWNVQVWHLISKSQCSY